MEIVNAFIHVRWHEQRHTDYRVKAKAEAGQGGMFYMADFMDEATRTIERKHRYQPRHALQPKIAGQDCDGQAGIAQKGRSQKVRPENTWIGRSQVAG